LDLQRVELAKASSKKMICTTLKLVGFTIQIITVNKRTETKTEMHKSNYSYHWYVP